MIRLIVADLDDTLLRSDKTISAYTIEVLQKCRARGIKIVFATARSLRAASRIRAQFEPDVFAGYGGALVTAGTEIIHRSDIPADVSARLIKDCLAAPKIAYILAINEAVALSNMKEKTIGDTAHYRYADFSRDYGHAYLKITVSAADPATVEKIAAHYPMCDMLRYRGEDLYRFANRDAVKWNAVKAIAAHYGIGTDEIAAFGDANIDVEMLANCGAGVAVANAAEEVKAAAGYTCGSNEEDGVARWLEENVL
ncbi:MAG: Cof-type HAD-IIB family hydrolase [Firmicutes bacterium]|nr:Cof-type HAD-IIB family hydrolase [Bacillota bacterium]